MRGHLFGKLRKLRIQASLNQQELAQLAGTTSSYISRLENDPFIRVRPEMRKKLADALGTTVEEVWDSPYDKLDLDDASKRGVTRGERAILRTYIKLSRTNRIKLIEILKQINEIENLSND